MTKENIKGVLAAVAFAVYMLVMITLIAAGIADSNILRLVVGGAMAVGFFFWLGAML